MAAEQEDYTKLPLEERVVHKVNALRCCLLLLLMLCSRSGGLRPNTSAMAKFFSGTSAVASLQMAVLRFSG